MLKTVFITESDIQGLNNPVYYTYPCVTYSADMSCKLVLYIHFLLLLSNNILSVDYYLNGWAQSLLNIPPVNKAVFRISPVKSSTFLCSLIWYSYNCFWTWFCLNCYKLPILSKFSVISHSDSSSFCFTTSLPRLPSVWHQTFLIKYENEEVCQIICYWLFAPNYSPDIC